MQLRGAMHLLEEDGHLTRGVQVLLAAVSNVPLPLVKGARVLPRHRNWLQFPWYGKARGGGAFVMGDRIYASAHLFDTAHVHALLLLLAHEVGHLPHAARFGPTASGRAQFVIWSAGHYLRSSVRHGVQWHRNARIEQEAERGRWVLRNLMAATTADPVTSVSPDTKAMTAWLHRHAGLLDRLHRAYPGWTAGQQPPFPRDPRK